MSEENVPKLRLKPKLAAETVSAPKPPAPPAPPAFGMPPAPPVDEPKAVRLKPKLAALAPQNAVPVVPPEPAPSPVEPPSSPGNFPPPVASFPPPGGDVQEKAASKFSLKPKAPADSASAPFPLPLPTVIGEVAPIPPPDYVDPEDPTAASSAASRSLTSRPFPPPPANFPPPPAGGTKPAPPWAQLSKTSSAPKKKKFALIGGGVAVVLIVLAGVFVAYQKFTAPPPVVPSTPKVVAKPKIQEPPATAPVETKSEPSVSAAIPATANNAVPEKTIAAPVPEPVEIAPPSAAFKAWVDALKVGGVRAGANTRVFIGGTAYATGELVNPQLGIVFDSYNAETRHLVFKDKTGATVERRN